MSVLTVTSIWFCSEYGWFNVLDANNPSSTAENVTIKKPPKKWKQL